VTFPDEVLMAYADGELDAQTRAEVEAAIASDPEIASRIAQHEALRRRVHSAFSKVLEEPLPARLLRVTRGEPAAAPNSNVVPLRRHPKRRLAWPQWSAVAASLIIGLVAGRLASVRFDTGPIVMRGGRVLASGALAGALSNQLAANQPNATTVRIGVSFRSRSGEFCRTFTLRQGAALGGVACRAADGWQIGVLAGTQEPGGGSASYRQAASAMPPAVVAAVADLIAGEPLDAQAEAAARARQWQPERAGGGMR
jgi:hypothetical protein